MNHAEEDQKSLEEAWRKMEREERIVTGVIIVGVTMLLTILFVWLYVALQ